MGDLLGEFPIPKMALKDGDFFLAEDFFSLEDEVVAALVFGEGVETVATPSSSDKDSWSSRGLDPKAGRRLKSFLNMMNGGTAQSKAKERNE